MLTYADDGIVQIEEFGMHVSVEEVVFTGLCVCVCERERERERERVSE